MSQRIVVEARRLTKEYRSFWGRTERVALSDLELSVEPGQIHGLIGPNGSGKSTALKLILGLLRPSSGSIAVFGESPRRAKAREKLSFMPEKDSFYESWSALEALDFVARLRGLPRRDRKRSNRELLAWVGLEKHAERRIHGLSFGLKRRLSLAQALVGDPDLLVLDEPTGGLDPLAVFDLTDRLRELRAQDKTIIVASHHLVDLRDLCDSAHLLYQGKTLRCGSLAEMTTRKNEFRWTLRHPPYKSEAEVRKAIQRFGAGVIDFEPSRRTLIDLFLSTFRSPVRKSKRESLPTVLLRRPKLMERLEQDDSTRFSKVESSEAGNTPPEEETLELETTAESVEANSETKELPAGLDLMSQEPGGQFWDPLVEEKSMPKNSLSFNAYKSGPVNPSIRSAEARKTGQFNGAESAEDLAFLAELEGITSEEDDVGKTSDSRRQRSRQRSESSRRAAEIKIQTDSPDNQPLQPKKDGDGQEANFAAGVWERPQDLASGNAENLAHDSDAQSDG